jgi:CheY-like chemotaxis protein
VWLADRDEPVAVWRRHQSVRSIPRLNWTMLRTLDEVATVLVVDDDPTVSEVVRGYLERAGLTVEQAGDGVTGLAMARATAPDLIVLDVMLPGLDGIEVCRQLRSQSRVPIVMLTALGAEVDRVLGLQMGGGRLPDQAVQPARAGAAGAVRVASRRLRQCCGGGRRTARIRGGRVVDRPGVPA